MRFIHGITGKAIYTYLHSGETYEYREEADVAPPGPILQGGTPYMLMAPSPLLETKKEFQPCTILYSDIEGTSGLVLKFSRFHFLRNNLPPWPVTHVARPYIRPCFYALYSRIITSVEI